MWDNLSSDFASKMIKEEADESLKESQYLERRIRFRGSEKEGSMKSFGLWDRLSKSEEGIEEFKDGIYGVNYKIIYEKLEKILERDVYPAMGVELFDV